MAEENNGSWQNPPASQPNEQPQQEHQAQQVVEGDQFIMANGNGTSNVEQPTETIPPTVQTPADVDAGQDAPTSAQPAVAAEAPQSSPYRPAPEYGAYGPTPTQPTTEQQPQTAPTQQMPVPGNRNPYLFGNPFQTDNGGTPNQGQGGTPANNAPTNPFMMPAGEWSAGADRSAESDLPAGLRPAASESRGYPHGQRRGHRGGGGPDQRGAVPWRRLHGDHRRLGEGADDQLPAERGLQHVR